MAAALPSSSAAQCAVGGAAAVGTGSGSGAADGPAQKSAYVSRFPGLQASRFGKAAATSSAAHPAPPAGSGAVAGSANEGDKNATASGACDDDEEVSEISGDVEEQAELLEAQKRASLLAADGRERER